LEIPKFQTSFSDLTFIQLSDLHISKFGFREKRLVDLVNREKPDAILITGDLVVNYRNNFGPCIETLKKLKASLGLYAVFGNSDHTFFPLENFKNFKAALKNIGVRVLENQNVELRHNGKCLHLVGVDDPFFHFDDFDRAIKKVPSNAPTILLAHSPDILFQRADALVVNLL